MRISYMFSVVLYMLYALCCMFYVHIQLSVIPLWWEKGLLSTAAAEQCIHARTHQRLITIFHVSRLIHLNSNSVEQIWSEMLCRRDGRCGCELGMSVCVSWEIGTFTRIQRWQNIYIALYLGMVLYSITRVLNSKKKIKEHTHTYLYIKRIHVFGWYMVYTYFDYFFLRVA